ncbi:uncharacterized protein LOC129892627 [Solanum dulcamara]|uniref:uncharacterized protein LOC129892627 n=1 Tax=Solanum dulcamara TaxID=45834 RepID=UPI0024862264|nr:uncharacterized protein LOC129892627 [Solanum dulcamara]
MKSSNINKFGMFKIREFNDEHTCSLKDRVYSQRQATNNLIGGIITTKLANHKRKYTPRDIMNDVKVDFGVDVTYSLAWRAKEKSVVSLRGTPSDSYEKLPSYLYTLDTTYPDSHIRMKKTEENEFLYLFISLFPFIKDFESCKPIIVVDGSHLKRTYNGTFVSASMLDGAENMCVVSDRNESIIKSVLRVYNVTPHYACI